MGRWKYGAKPLADEGWSVVGVIPEILRGGGGPFYARVIMQRPKPGNAQEAKHD